MNSIVTDELGILHETQALRTSLMEILDDADLAYKLPGANPTFGELCVMHGEVEQAYIDSFKTFKLDWTYRNSQPGLASSVAAIQRWYADLDAELDATLTNLSEDDIANRLIERGFMIQPRVQLYVYRESILIFSAKAMVYLNALHKKAPDQLREWIG